VAKNTNVYPSKINSTFKAELFADYYEFLGHFGHNLRALRVYCGLSSQSFVDDLMSKYNFKTNYQTILLIEENKLNDYRPLSLNYLLSLARYWRIPLINLLTIDYSIEDNLPDHIKLMKKYNKGVISSITLTNKNKPIPLLSSFANQNSIGSVPLQP